MLSKHGQRKELSSGDLILSQTQRDSEISRTQGNSSCHQVALATVEKTQGARGIIHHMGTVQDPEGEER